MKTATTLPKAAKSLPPASNSKPAAALKTFVAAHRVVTSIPIARKHLRTFEFYSEHYNVPVTHLIQSGAYDQAAALTDDPFSFLEGAEESISHEELETIPLEFCPDAHALLSRAAELLRRPFEDFLQGLVAFGAVVLADNIESALGNDGIFGKDMDGWANSAIDFERLARRNKTPGLRDTCKDGWGVFNLERPEKRQARLAMAGGAA